MSEDREYKKEWSWLSLGEKEFIYESGRRVGEVEYKNDIFGDDAGRFERFDDPDRPDVTVSHETHNDMGVLDPIGFFDNPAVVRRDAATGREISRVVDRGTGRQERIRNKRYRKPETSKAMHSPSQNGTSSAGTKVRSSTALRSFSSRGFAYSATSAITNPLARISVLIAGSQILAVAMLNIGQFMMDLPKGVNLSDGFLEWIGLMLLAVVGWFIFVIGTLLAIPLIMLQAAIDVAILPYLMFV